MKTQTYIYLILIVLFTSVSHTFAISDNGLTEKESDEQKVLKSNNLLDKEMAPQFNVYPQINDGSMWLAYELQSKGQVVLYTNSGVELDSYKLDQDERFHLIKRQDLESGVYFYKVFENGLVVHSGKFIVRNY